MRAGQLLAGTRWYYSWEHEIIWEWLEGRRVEPVSEGSCYTSSSPFVIWSRSIDIENQETTFYLQWASHFTQGQSNEDMSQCRNRQDLPVLMSLQIPKKAVNTQTRLQVQKARRFPLIVVVSCHWPMLQICWRFLSNTLCAINPLINKVDSSNVS